MSILEIAEKGSTFLLYKLIKSNKDGINLNEINDNGDTGLHILTRKENIECLNLLIRAGCDLNLRNNKLKTPLMMAIDKKNNEIVEFLIKEGANVNIYNDIPLIWESFINNNLRIFNELLKGKVDFTINYDGKSLLFEILTKKLSEYILPLFNAGYNMNETHNNIFSLHYSIEIGNISCMKNLLQTNIDISIKNNKNENSYMIAKKKDSDIFRLLIEKTVNHSKNGKNIINNIIIDNDIETLIELYNKGMNFDCKDDSGKTPLMTAVESNNLEIVGNLIYDAEVDFEIKDNTGHTATYIAAIKGYYEIMNCLISGGAEFEIENENGLTLMKYLLKNKSEEGISLLINYGIDIDKEYNNKYPIYKACKYGNINILKLLLEASKDLDIYQYGKLPLIKAIKNKFMEGIKLLTRYGFELDISTSTGNSSLYYAFKTKDETIVDYIIKHGEIDVKKKVKEILFKIVNKKDVGLFNFFTDYLEKMDIPVNYNIKNMDSTLLDLTIVRNTKEIFDVLIKKGVDLNYFINFPPLHKATLFGRSEMLEIIIEKNVDLNQLSLDGYTALGIAIKKGYDDCVAILISAGAKVNKPGHRSISCLEIAIDSDKSRFIKILHSNGARIDIKDSNGDTLIHRAINIGSETSIKELHDIGLNLDEKNNAGITPLFYSIELKKLSCLKQLITLGVNINQKDSKGFSVLHCACKKGFLLGITYLLDAGININIKGINGITPLITSARFNRENSIYVLVQRGANLEQSTYTKETALITAVANGNLNSVKALINSGANFKIRDKNQKTLIEISELNNHFTIAEYLRDIKRLGKVSEEWRNIDECPICISSIEKDKVVKGCNKCRHIFHITCFSEWINQNNRCPLCNTTNKKDYTDLIR